MSTKIKLSEEKTTKIVGNPNDIDIDDGNDDNFESMLTDE